MTTKNFRVRNGLTIGGATSGSTSLNNSATGTDISYTLPTAQGASATVLTNDGSGTLSWALPGGGGSTFGNITIGVDTDNTISTTTGTLNINSAVTSGVQTILGSNADALSYGFSSPTNAGLYTDHFINGNIANNIYNTTNNGIVRPLRVGAPAGTGITPAAGYGVGIYTEATLPDGSYGSLGWMDFVSGTSTPGDNDSTFKLYTFENSTQQLSAQIDSSGAIFKDKVQITGETSGYVALTAGFTPAAQSYTLPDAYPGVSGYVLSSTTGGTMSWVANPDTNTTYTIDASTTTGGANFNLTGSDATTDTIKYANGTGITAVATDASTITLTNTGVTSAVAGTGVSVSAATGDVTFSIGQSVATTADPTFNSIQLTAGTIKSSAGVTAITVSNNDATITDFLTVGGDMRVSGNTIYSSTNTALELSGQNVSTYGDLTVQGGDITLNGSTSGTVTLSAGATPAVQTYTLPSSYPASSAYGSYLTSSTGGAMSWASAMNPLTMSAQSLSVRGSTSGSNTFTSPAVAGTQSYTLPTSYPASTGYVLSSTTTGTLSWVASGGGGGSSVAGVKSLNMAIDAGGIQAPLWSLPPGLTQSPTGAAPTALTTGQGYLWYVPIAIDTTIDISAFMFNVNTATGVTVAPSVQVFINNVDNNWQPTTNALYLGEVTGITTTGNKSVSGLTGKVLSPGNYILGLQISTFTATTFALGVKSALPYIPGTALITDAGLGSIYYWSSRVATTYISGSANLAGYDHGFGSTGSAGVTNLVYLRYTKV